MLVLVFVLVLVLVLIFVLVLGDSGPLNFDLGLRTRSFKFVRAGGIEKNTLFGFGLKC